MLPVMEPKVYADNSVVPNFPTKNNAVITTTLAPEIHSQNCSRATPIADHGQPQYEQTGDAPIPVVAPIARWRMEVSLRRLKRVMSATQQNFLSTPSHHDRFRFSSQAELETEPI